MNGTGTDQAAAYVEAVRTALADLPASAREEMLDDLDEHLAEVAAEGGDLVGRLGSPQVYAAELRAAAGFVGGFPDPPEKKWDQLAEARATVARALGSADVRVGPLLGYARASEFLILLRPAWWVLRGYLAAMVTAWVLDGGSESIGLLPRIGGSEVVSLLLLAAGVLGSIWLGRRTDRLSSNGRYVLVSSTVVLVVVALAGFLEVDSIQRGARYDSVDNYEQQNPYDHVRDVFVYDSQGRLIEGARLLDQNGQPIRLGSPYCPAVPSVPGEYPGEVEVDSSTYPYCVQNAPFRLSSPSPSASPTPSVPALTPSASPIR